MVNVENLKQTVLKWLSNGKEDAKTLVDLQWKLKWDRWHLILENEKIPFSFLIGFHEEALHVTLETDVETAVMDTQQRLAIYRVLLILNQRIDLAKFMLFGINEEVIVRVDLATDSLSREELNLSLNILLSSLYLMVNTLHLEEEMQNLVRERMLMMIQDLISQGKSRDDILQFMTKNLGINAQDAERILDQIMPQHKEDQQDSMYR
ncbi:MAG: hypothetical protein M1149_02415 [Candidatus Thermoplasmatota archaeon]|jgi:hypothetical protein|nr:hypothetical protein [Candidatus Thermoplasmatota archaeon]